MLLNILQCPGQSSPPIYLEWVHISLYIHIVRIIQSKMSVVLRVGIMNYMQSVPSLGRQFNLLGFKF